MALTVQENSLANVKDYLLTIDDLGQPKVVDMTKIEPGRLNSAATMIMRLILLKKGTYPDLPDMGVDIRGRYRFAYEDELPSLQNDIAEQIATYLPEMLPIDITVETATIPNTLMMGILISIISEQTKFVLLYNIADNTLEGIKQK